MMSDEDSNQDDHEQQQLKDQQTKGVDEDDMRKRMIGAAQPLDGMKQLNNKVLDKISTGLLARAFLPSPKDVKAAISFLDLGIKFQIMLYEWSCNLFWTSILEVSIFLFFQVLFLTNPSRMVGLYFHIVHLPRGAVGLFLVKVMPNSHDMLKEIRIPSDAKIPFGKIADKVMGGAVTCVQQFSDKCQKLLLAYGVLTIITLTLDLISFFREISAYGSKLWEDAFADVSLLVLASVLIALDLFYFAWIFCTVLKFPRTYTKYLIFGLCGIFKHIVEALGGSDAPILQKPAAK
jgi:hypothetical protein